jgi:hypothetical protein
VLRRSAVTPQYPSFFHAKAHGSTAGPAGVA